MLALFKNFLHVQKEKPKSIKILQWVYLFILVFIVLFVTFLHSTDRSVLETLRLPLFFREAEPHLNVSYVTSLTVYHFTFAYFILIIVIDIVTFFNYSNEFLRKLSLLATVFGFAIFGFMMIYFFYSIVTLWFANSTITFFAIVFFLLSVSLFLLDLITYLIEERDTKLNL